MEVNGRDENRRTSVRRIGPTRRSVSGYHSFRGEDSVPFESTLERDFLVRTEFDLSVSAIVSQPASIPFVAGDGRPSTYTPDFLVYYRLGDRHYEDYPRPMLVEVKPREEWRDHWREWSPKWKAADRYAREQGWTFRIHDEGRIRDVVLGRIRFLERYERMAVPPEDVRSILNTVGEMGSVTVDFLLARHFAGLYRARGQALLWHLLARRRLDADLHRPLDDHTEVWAAPHA